MGILSGAMGGLGGAVSDIATGHIKNELNIDFQRELMAMQEQRDVRADERRQRIRRDDDQYSFDKKIERSPQEIEMETNKKRAVGDVETDQQRTREGNRRIDELGFKAENLGEMTKIEREMAQARDMDGEGRGIRNDLGREQIADRQEIRKEREERTRLLGEYENAIASKDKDAETAAEKKIRAHDRKFGRQDSLKEWRVVNTPDGVIRENVRTGAVEQVDVRGLPTHRPGGATQGAGSRPPIDSFRGK